MEQSTANVINPICSENRTMDPDYKSQNKDVAKFPELFCDSSLLELSNSFWKRAPDAKKDLQPYLRGCKWSPDGTCCLSVVNHDGFHIMELPRDLYEGCPSRERMITLLPAVVHVKEFGLIYDFCWYPKMNSHYPETCSWISTKVNSPIQMWDAYNGSLRCSYRGFNAVDEMEPAISVTFIDYGHRIVGGYKNCLRTFDVERPGREFLEYKIKSPASCFATHGNLLAVGSWNSNIKLFSILDNGMYRSVGNLYAHTGGITHLQFTPDGTKLVSGARKDHSICVWDMRYQRMPLNILKRCVNTNQRIYFDISSCGRYLVSGGTDGVVRVWDNNVTKWTEPFNVNDENQENATFQFQIYRDCCNSVSIHPSRPILATGSGQYHFLDPVKVLEIDCDKGSNHDNGARVQSPLVSNASCKETDIEDDLFTKTHDIKLNDNARLHTEEDSKHESNEVVTINSTEDLSDSIPEVSALNLIETCCEPPAKKPKLSNETSSSTVEEGTDGESSINLPVLGTGSVTELSIEQIHKEPQASKNSEINAVNQPFAEESNLNDTTNPEAQLCIETKSNSVVSTIHETIKESSSTAKECHLTTEEVIHNTSQQSSVCEPTIKDNIDVQLSNKTGEVDAATIQEHTTSTEDASRNFDVGILSACKSLDGTFQRSAKDNNDSQLTSNPIKSDETVAPPTKIPTVQNIEQSTNTTCLVTSESDDDYNDINENKMRYSSYAENNLSFWWIGKIVD